MFGVDSTRPEQIIQLTKDIRNLFLRIHRRLDDVDVELPVDVTAIGDG